MKRILLTAAALLGSALITTPASAWFTHTHYCNCGHKAGKNSCGSSSSSTTGGTTTGGTTTSTSGGTTTTSTSGGTTTTSTSGGTTTTTSGGSTSSTSGGTAVPEPGMLGMMGLGFVGLALARRRRR